MGAPERGFPRPGRRLAASGVVAALAALALILWLTVGQPRDQVWERIQASGVWRVGMDPSFPPFESLDAAGQPVGFDVDLARAIADRWGVGVQFEGVGFDGLVDAVWAGRIDTALSALPLQPQFSQDVAFSRPYFEAGLVLATAPERVDLAGLDDLAGLRIAVEWGSEGDLQARAAQRRLAGVTVLAQETAGQALQAVADRQADAALVDRVSALRFAAAGLVRIAGQAVTPDPYVVVMPRRASVLQQQVDEALQALAAEGVLAELEARWLAAPP